MGFYSKVIFPRFYDCVMDRPFWAKYRQEQLANVNGEILEIGVGTGLNLEHYPEHVRKITTVDPNPGMNKILQRRIEKSGIEVDKRVISSEELPFDDATFDSVVSTMTLCSIPDVQQAMSELYRVLRPGGRFFFLEHGLSDEPKMQKWQRRLNWFQMRFADGCRLEVNIRGVFSGQPFETVEMDNFYMEKTAKTHGYMYRGQARNNDPSDQPRIGFFFMGLTDLTPDEISDWLVTRLTIDAETHGNGPVEGTLGLCHIDWEQLREIRSEDD